MRSETAGDEDPARKQSRNRDHRDAGGDQDPAVAWVLAVPVLGLDPFLAATAVIVAALPVGANVYIFAQHYDVAVPQASSAILISTGISMVTIPVLLWLII